MKRVLLLCMALMMLLALPAQADESTLVVSGSGTVYMEADCVSATVGVELGGEDLTSLQQQVNATVQAVCEALEAAGLDEKSISTNQFYVSPRYDYDSGSGMFRGSGEPQELIVGYTISNTLSIRTDDIDRIGAYIDAAFAAGANTFGSISFSVKDDTRARAQALELAVQDARAKAEIIAAAAGKQLEGIEQICEGGVSSYAKNASATMWSYDGAVAESAAGTTVRASQVVVSADIQITYELK